MRRFFKGNIVKFGTSFWIVADEHDDDKGYYVRLIATDACNCSSGVSDYTKHKEYHVDRLEYVAEHMYSFIEKGMLRFLDDLGKGKK